MTRLAALNVWNDLLGQQGKASLAAKDPHYYYVGAQKVL